MVGEYEGEDGVVQLTWHLRATPRRPNPVHLDWWLRSRRRWWPERPPRPQLRPSWWPHTGRDLSTTAGCGDWGCWRARLAGRGRRRSVASRSAPSHGPLRRLGCHSLTGLSILQHRNLGESCTGLIAVWCRPREWNLFASEACTWFQSSWLSFVEVRERTQLWLH